MNADNSFHIGHNHIICEDYSLSGVTEDGTKGFIIVSDGCSASKDVDIGSRILALAARETWVKMNSNLFLNKKKPVEYLDFGSQIINRANTIPPLFPSLDVGVLDATLLMVWIDDKVMKMVIYGDGVFFHKTKDRLHTIHVSFSNSAPNYLCYLLNEDKKQEYLNIGGKKEITNTIFVDGKEITVNTIEVSPFEPVTFESAVEEGDVVSLCSDGINSFKKSDSSSIPWQELISDYVGFKNFEGAFVKRRFGAFKRKCVKEGIVHGDDISIASIVV